MAGDSRTICVSQDHARRHGTRAFVRNGVRLDEYEFKTEKEDYDLFLARLHSVKGWQVAVAAPNSVACGSLWRVDGGPSFALR